VRLVLSVVVALVSTLVASGKEPADQAIDASSIKVVAFDVFGTVFNFDGVERGQIGDYVKHVNSDEWSPLQLPKSWEEIPAHDDSPEGIWMLRQKFTVVTLSNGPMRLLAKISKSACIEWDAIVPIEMARVYKPNLDAYRTVMELFQCDPHEVLMVTANPLFGDVEAAKELGMQVIVIREPGLKQVGLKGPKTIIELAETLGAKE
jgi:HAD superfamily hydrolase (TIGR01493 family)